MALTPDLIARVARVVEDAGPSPGAVYLTDEDYEIAVRNILAQAPSGDVWLFGYGSLLWKPAFEYVESRMASVRGYHRSFCIRVARFRGTRDLPGLMMALDRGGQCEGTGGRRRRHFQGRRALGDVRRIPAQYRLALGGGRHP
jgi:glutathione-specific gamma-glutamylcyclotransferase